eukprot:TRINITY_DN5943_c1_g1_i1.p1 TRINITY_DN5943_c1_g1~~TRINITY_DN5943_c1_g1_i1.p1  ORF type:complete len:298 (+),score=77.47 TRINITY_DN5943_c1_g1_i1:3-896(+)
MQQSASSSSEPLPDEVRPDIEEESLKDDLSSLGSGEGCIDEPTLDGIHVVNNDNEEEQTVVMTEKEAERERRRKEEERKMEEEKRTADSIGLFFGVHPEDRLIPRAAYDSLLTRLSQLENHLATATKELRIEQDKGRETEDKCAELARALQLASDSLRAEGDQQRELQRKLQQKEDELLFRERTVEILEQRLRSRGAFVATKDQGPVGNVALSTRPNRMGGIAPSPVTGTPATILSTIQSHPSSQPSRLPRLSSYNNNNNTNPVVGSSGNGSTNSQYPLPPDLTARGGGRLTSLGFV